MENFIWNIPTQMHFGTDVCLKIRTILPIFGHKVMLLRGGESTVKNGIRAKMLTELNSAGVEWIEFSGIKSNPEIEETRAAVEMGRGFRPDVILAVGGGSVIDTAKAVAAAIPVDNDPWDLYTGKLKPKTAIPVIAVLTLAATGTEMNPFSVMQNRAEGIKTSFMSRLVAPKYSFLDPAFTVSVPRTYTAYGISDLVAHAMEAWFGEGDASLADRFVVAIIQEAIEYGPRLLKEVDNVDMRARIMFAATCALNELTMFGRKSGDWGVHGLGHVFSLLYGIPHGATLSAIFPAWMKHVATRDSARIAEFGKAVFGVSGVDQTIDRTVQMFRSFLSPTNLGELKIEDYDEERVVDAMIRSEASGYHCFLGEEDFRAILGYM
ncbi:MAG TPA: iron-containing alcohol dehydrogenase [Bacteroidales bacterium]|nr:iron-containing alcohol dehydrogenase [Bacteroidales bacterium]